MFNIANCYMLYVRCKHIGGVAPDFLIQVPMYLYTEMAMMQEVLKWATALPKINFSF